MVRIYCVDAAALDDATLQRWLPRIAPEKAERIRRMKPNSARTSMAGELLARYGIGQCFGIPPQELQIQPDALGKPQILSHSGIHFNISHSGSLCVCAVGDVPVGIDLQLRKPTRFAQMAKRVFTEKEYALYESFGATEDAFYRLWARKEALTKLTGDGLRMLGHDITVPHQILLETVYENCRLCVVCAADPLEDPMAENSP